MKINAEEIGGEEEQVHRVEDDLTSFSCPLCSAALDEHLKGPATLFVCPNCGFKILTTKELFSNCFRTTV